jgi:hypothetical protein
MSRSCSGARRRRLRAASPLVRSAEDAIDLFLRILSSLERPQVAALLLDHRHRAVAAVTGADEPDHGLVELCEAVADVADPDIRAIALASVEPDPDATAWLQQHEVDWSIADATLDDAGLHLVDWFAFLGGFALSVSELVLHREPPWDP